VLNMKKKSYSKKNKKTKREDKATFRRVLLWVSLGVVTGLMVLLVMSFYLDIFQNKFFRVIYTKIPLPVVRVEQEYIFSNQLLSDVEAVRKFYQSNDYARKNMRVDFSTTEGQMRLQIKERAVLNKLIEDIIVRRLAEKRGIRISEAEVNKGVETALQNSGGTYRQLALSLKANYGWTVDDFKNKIVKNQLYLQKLFDWYKRAVKNTDSYQEAENVLNKINVQKDNFKELAEKYSEGESARQQGEFNWMRMEQIIPEVAEEVKKMKPGEISGVIISPLGLHIVKLEDRKSSEEEGGEIGMSGEQVRLRQIFFRKDNFVDWLQQQKKLTAVKVFWQRYWWDKKRGEVVFGKESQREAERIVKMKSQGDPSME
jgi:parvulin-like peptidyl-prolyl isomerase